MNRLHQLLIAISTATLLYGRLYIYTTSAEHRMFASWSHGDAALLTGAVLLMGAILYAAYRVAAGTRWKRWAQGGFVFVFFFAIIYSVGPTVLQVAPGGARLWKLVLLALLVVPGVVALCFPRWRVAFRLAQVALVLSPLFFMMTLHIFREPIYPMKTPEFRASFPARDEVHPIVLLIFDEWSYARSTAEGEFLPFLKNLNGFRQRAFTFHRNLSPATKTTLSVPRLMLQQPVPLRITDRGYLYEESGSWHPASRLDNLFRSAKEQRYHTSLVGCHVQPGDYLGPDDLDYAYVKPTTYHVLKKAYCRFFEQAANAAISIARATGISVSKNLEADLQWAKKVDSEHWRDLLQELKGEFHATLDRSSPNSLSVLHVLLPHGPFIFGPDGSYLGPYREATTMPFDPDGYQRSLAYLDHVIGEILERIDQRFGPGRAMVIITSDHSWRADKRFHQGSGDPDSMRHVPLLVRLPGQSEAVSISEQAYASHLGPAIRAVMRGELEQAGLAMKSMAGRPERDQP